VQLLEALPPHYALSIILSNLYPIILEAGGSHRAGGMDLTSIVFSARCLSVCLCMENAEEWFVLSHNRTRKTRKLCNFPSKLAYAGVL